MLDLFQDYLKSINETKRNVMRENPDDPKAVSGFSSFLVRRLLSYHKDCVLFVNEINCIKGLDEQLQYEFLLHAIPKKKRFAKLHKVPSPKNLDLIKRYYNYSDVKAMEIVGLHTPEQLAKIEKDLSEGGILSEKRKSSIGDGRNSPNET